MSSQGWWYRASRAQRLAQIDGGLECGMTGRQIAMISGIPEAQTNQVTAYGRLYGRKFTQHYITPKGGSGKLQTKHRDAQYRRGEPVDFWGNTQPDDEFRLDEVDQP